MKAEETSERLTESVTSSAFGSECRQPSSPPSQRFPLPCHQDPHLGPCPASKRPFQDAYSRKTVSLWTETRHSEVQRLGGFRKRRSTHLLLVVYGVVQLTRWLRKLRLAAVLTVCNRVLWPENGVLPFNFNCLKNRKKQEQCKPMLRSSTVQQ